jgi:nucleotide-binding universal stress UspA family protein
MFKHLLVPIDGFDLSKQAMHKAVGMAKEGGQGHRLSCGS